MRERTGRRAERTHWLAIYAAAMEAAERSAEHAASAQRSLNRGPVARRIRTTRTQGRAGLTCFARA